MTNSRPHSSDRTRAWLLAALALSALLALANWPLLSGKAFEQWDAFDFFSPYYSLVADFSRAGHLLFWNPWTNGGTPDFAEPQLGAFSPILLLFSLVFGGSGGAFRLYWLALWLTGGMGMLLLARHLRAPVWGGSCIALGFIFSGFYTGHAEHTSVVYSYSLLPFVIWRLDVALARGSLFAAAQSGALWGLSAMAGNPAITISTCGLIVAWVVGRIWFSEDRSSSTPKHGLAVLVVFALVGAVVLAPTYFSFLYEGHGFSDRSEPLSRAVATGSNALHPGALITLLSPAFLPLRFADPRLWSYTDVSSLNLYLGAVILVLAVLALTRRGASRWRWFLFAVAVVVLACSLSRVLPLRGWLYDLLPPSRYFRHSSMFRGYVMFLICVLALLGARDLGEFSIDRALRGRFLLVATFLCLIAAASYSIVAFVVEVENPFPPISLIHLFAIWGGLVLLALVVDRAPARFLPLLPGTLLALAVADGLITCHLSEGTLYGKGPSPDRLVPHESSIELNSPRADRRFAIGRADLNLLPKIPTLSGYAAFKNRFHEATVADPVLASIALGHDRFWFSASAPSVALTPEAFGKFAARVHAVGAVIVRHSRKTMLHSLGADPGQTQGLETAVAATRVPARIIHYLPDHLTLQVSVPGNGWLMVTDRWSRSWEATVNGKAVPVEGADFIYRAIPVTEGSNRVEFAFHPFAARALASLSWSLLGGIGLLSCFRVGRRKTPPEIPMRANETRDILERIPIEAGDLPFARTGQSSELP